jgi:hypothetical protein
MGDPDFIEVVTLRECRLRHDPGIGNARNGAQGSVVAVATIRPA